MKIGLIVCCYNRPDYLRQCFESLIKADLSLLHTILIVDDCSNDKNTRRLIDDFEIEGVQLIKAFSKENRSIKGSLIFGLDLLFKECDLVTNLDSDAIVKEDFLKVLVGLKNRFQENIITGFNCVTKNKNGSERHKVLKVKDDYTERLSVGGINMMFDLKQYENFVRPAIVKSIENNLNWDDHTCRASIAAGHKIITSKPSVVQHIGIESSMGHSAGGEPPDVADDFNRDYSFLSKPVSETTGDDFRSLWSTASGKDYVGSDKNFVQVDEEVFFGFSKIYLKNVTLIAVDDNIHGIIKAADISCKHIEFGAVKLLSSMDSSDPRAVKIRMIGSKAEYSEFMMKELANYIDTKYLLIIQADGYVINAAAWRNEWYQYDYIGAPWEWYTDGMQVGNGGFSFRSRKIMQIAASDNSIIAINEPGVSFNKEEDHCIARLYRKYLEKEYEIKFAPIEEARKFSIEGWKSENKTWANEFGFHGHGITNVKP